MSSIFSLCSLWFKNNANIVLIVIYKGDHEGHEESYGNIEFDDLSNKVMDWQLRLNMFINFILQFFVSFVVEIIKCSDMFGLRIAAQCFAKTPLYP